AMLTEVDVPNADRALFAGMYAQVAFDVEREARLIVVPATSTLFDAKGPRVAIVRDGLVHWASVQVESDLGERLVIATGISEGDLVAVTPSERLLEGARVQAEVTAPGEGAGAAASDQPSPTPRKEPPPSQGTGR
ncbi:MAG: hypothetical protein M3O50_10890, partial [Myxococcota bacterium]|nr:hypothetical protein [Myxococcota bacterium]